MTARRFWLLVKAVILRVLMRISMFFHGYPFPRPPRPAFTRTLPSHPSCSQPVNLLFYTPPDYSRRVKNDDDDDDDPQRYPVVVNFHGGGFCLGRASDDARFARTLVDNANAVVVSVDYRLAPEWPFPAAVDDGVDALLYLEAHADELSLDISRVAITGFSAGGNLAFTVPLRFHSLIQTRSSVSSSKSNNNPQEEKDIAKKRKVDDDDKTPNAMMVSSPLRIVAITSWYPILDFLVPRHIRRDRSLIPSKTLPPFLTSLFDESYLPHLTIDGASPYASPLRADDAVLAAALPRDVFIYMCEWDMLEHEGREFVQRLESSERAREDGRIKVRSMVIEQSCHAWDKSANPFRDQGRIDVLYRAASEELKTIFQKRR